jgi:hypothetical protein
MRVITFLLAVAACAGVVMNHLQLREIRQQVEQMQVQLASQQRTGEAASITEAKRHLQRALELISAGNLEQARTELERGSKALAPTDADGDDTRRTLQQVQQMVESARKELARFWSGKQESKP